MKSKTFSFGAAFLLFFCANGLAADILGNWIAKIPSGLVWFETVLSFKPDGTKLSGTITNACGATKIREGEINGDEIKFIAEGSGRDDGITFIYKGKIGLNEIQFTRQRKDGTGQSQSFIAAREFLRHNDYIQRPALSSVAPPNR
jgi:hypothetical protein